MHAILSHCTRLRSPYTLGIRGALLILNVPRLEGDPKFEDL
jgi:hypothetical protein